MDVRQLKTDCCSGRLSADQLFDTIDKLHQTVKRLQGELIDSQRLGQYEPGVLQEGRSAGSQAPPSSSRYSLQAEEQRRRNKERRGRRKKKSPGRRPNQVKFADAHRQEKVEPTNNLAERLQRSPAKDRDAGRTNKTASGCASPERDYQRVGIVAGEPFAVHAAQRGRGNHPLDGGRDQFVQAATASDHSSGARPGKHKLSGPGNVAVLLLPFFPALAHSDLRPNPSNHRVPHPITPFRPARSWPEWTRTMKLTSFRDKDRMDFGSVGGRSDRCELVRSFPAAIGRPLAGASLDNLEG